MGPNPQSNTTPKRNDMIDVTGLQIEHFQSGSRFLMAGAFWIKTLCLAAGSGSASRDCPWDSIWVHQTGRGRSRSASETHFRPSSPVHLVSSLSSMSRVSRAKRIADVSELTRSGAPLPTLRLLQDITTRHPRRSTRLEPSSRKKSLRPIILHSGETKLIDPAGAEFPPSADIRARAKPTGEARCFTSPQSIAVL